MDKEKLAAISSYLDNVFDFDEFIKAKEKFDSSNTLSNNDNDAGSGKQASMSSLRSSLSGRSVVLDMVKKEWCPGGCDETENTQHSPYVLGGRG